MPEGTPPARRRERIERNIYRRPDGTLEVHYKDGAGRQRMRTVRGGILAARRQRDDLLAKRARGERSAPNPRLRFGAAAADYLERRVSTLRPGTREVYRANVGHLTDRFATARLDAITPDDLARLVADLRERGYAEWTIAGVLGAAGRVYKHAARRMGWAGPNPVPLLEAAERAKPSASPARRIFTRDEAAQTIAAAAEPWRTVLLVAATTGARMSEVLGLRWADLHLDDLDAADVVIGAQLGRDGIRQPLKTDGSARVLPIPRQLAEALARFRLARGLAGRDTTSGAFVFATATGSAVSHRNLTRALRAAQKAARRPDGRPTFPPLHEVDDKGKPRPVPRGAVPSFHALRHGYASHALAEGESVDEVAFLLGHRDGSVTRAVYIHEVDDARRRTLRRERMGAASVSVMSAYEGSDADDEA